MKRFTLILSLLVIMVTTAMAQATYEQKIPHALYKVTALSEAGVSGNEGGIAFIEDNKPKTFYHSNWNASYEGGTEGKKKGQDGLQAFMVELPIEYTDITKITYAGRPDKKDSGWAKKVRIYTYTTLPEGLTTNLSSLSYEDKESKLGKESTILGTPVFNNNEEGVWGTDLDIYTATFAKPESAKYILFVMDEGCSDGYLTCADFNIYYSITLNENVTITEIEDNKPYYLKITNINNATTDYYVDITTPKGDTSGPTIGRSETPVATYFQTVDGSLHISNKPNSELAYNNTFLGLSNWCATPNTTTPTNYDVEYEPDGTLELLQSSYYGAGNKARCYLGGDAIINGGEKIFTDNLKSNAIRIQLVTLSETELAKENARLVLARTGVGYPAAESEARVILQTAMDAEGATVESINSAIETYKAATDVVMPEAGKVYRIVSALPGFASNNAKKAIYCDTNSGSLNWNTLNENALNYMWVAQDVDTEKKFITLMNLDNAMYPQSSGFSNQVKASNVPNECSYEFFSYGQFKIMANKLQGFHANNHGSGSGNGSGIINYNTEKDGASAWYIQEVPVTQDMFNRLIAVVEPAYATSALVVESEGKTALKTAIDNARNSSEYATAFASVTTALANANTEFVDQVYLYMKSKQGGNYAYCGNDGKELAAKAGKTIKSILKFKKANNGTYYIQTDNGLFAQNVATSQRVSLGASPVEYTIRSSSTGYYLLRPTASTNDHQYLHDPSWDGCVGWNPNGENTHWAFELLGDDELANIYEVEINVIPDVTATVKYNGEYTGNNTVKNNGGFFYFENTPAENDFTINGIDESIPHKAAINSNKISLLAGYPAENMYILRCKKGNSYARYHSGSTLNAEDNTNMLTYEATCRYESLFYIEEGSDKYEGYYTIRPVAAPDKYVYNLGTADENSKVATKEAPDGDVLTDEYYWNITSFTKTPGNITPYGENAGDYGWNKRGGYNGYNHIGYWKGGNATEDNYWTVITFEEAFIPEYTMDDSTIGLATYASVEESVKALEYMTPTNLNVITSAQYTDVVAPKKGGYYRLKNAASNNYMSGNANNITLLTNGSEAKSTVFYLDEDNALLSYNAGLYLSCYNKGYTGIGAVPADGKFSFAYGGITANTITYYNNSSTGAWTYGAGNDGANLDRGTGTPNKNGYNWVVEPVVSLPVTISDAGYATLYAPVALEIPAEVKAYTVTINEEWATLTAIEDGVIPANTGVVICGENGEAAKEGTYNFKITTTEAKIESALKGTVAAAYITDDAYVLGYADITDDGVKEAYFGRATKNQQNGTSWKNNSHKAYLPAPANAEGIKSYSFRFGEGTTGIEEVKTENGNVKGIYDLTGRRVEAITAPGIYIVNGKKVLVK